MKKLLDILEIEDLNDGMKFIADRSGIEFTKTLLLNHPGEKIYVPCLRYVRPLVKRFLKENIKTGSYQELLRLSKDMQVSVEYISILLREMYDNKSKL
jgi:hypothetical protein